MGIISWLVAIGCLLIGVAIGVWGLSEGNRTVAIWAIGVPGTILLVIAGGLELQKYVSEPFIDANRPYISIAAIGFPEIVISPGPVIIKWDIKNSGRSLARIIESNMTVWFATEDGPLPVNPVYIKTSSRFTGVEIGPGEVFNATFKSEKVLTSADIQFIRDGKSLLHAYGFVKFADERGAVSCKGYIALYEPSNDPRFGMFTRAEEKYPAYKCDN